MGGGCLELACLCWDLQRTHSWNSTPGAWYNQVTCWVVGKVFHKIAKALTFLRNFSLNRLWNRERAVDRS